MTGTGSAYPTAADMAERWTRLSHEMAETRSARGVRQDGINGASPKGELVILGSGIAHFDFTADAEAEIRSADHVFYCLYDRVTLIWLNGLRPDAFDLKVLYGSDTDRYWTYIRMAEAMLHHVRLGRKVVGVFYGHPGIFSMPPHRAVQIARREGHRAVMRPGISALDYLIADIGFDPALPGMLSYEATDMLLRKRRIDPTLHVILWQVGVVGERGFAPDGFENRGYDLLVDVIERTYGSDWEVTHYIAPQFAGVEPLIERNAIGDLKRSEVRRKISALSTWYIEPMEARATDREHSVLLGLTKPEDPVEGPRNRYDCSLYGEYEEAALKCMGLVSVGPEYSIPQATPAYDFMMTLSRDLALQARYRADAGEALRDPRFGLLNERARKLLAIPNPTAIEAAIWEPPIDQPSPEAAF